MWHIDSGCSRHMTGNKAFLKDYIELAKGAVKFGNLGKLKIRGNGSLSDGQHTIKKDVTLKAWAIIFLAPVSFVIMVPSYPVCLWMHCQR